MTGFMPGSLIRPAPLEIPGCMMFSSGISGSPSPLPAASSTAVEGLQDGGDDRGQIDSHTGVETVRRRVDCPQNRKQTPENRAFA